MLEAIGFRERAALADLVVTGEGTVDRTSFEGKAPGEAVRACAELGVRCLLFGGPGRGRASRRSRSAATRLVRARTSRS